MKSIKMKKLILSAAIAGAVALTIPAVAENSAKQGVDRATTNTMENRAVPRDQNITNPNTENYTTSQSTSMTENAEVDHEGVVHFEPNSVSLSQQAEGQLKQLVEQLEKDKPVALSIETRDGYGDQDASSSISTAPQSQSVAGNRDSSAGYPAEGEGLAGRVNPGENMRTPSDAGSNQPANNAEALQAEQQNRAQLISQYRAENIRQYLQERGIEVVEMSMEDNSATESGGAQQTEDSRLSGMQEPASGQSDIEDVQQVRIVVIGEVRPEGLSAL